MRYRSPEGQTGTVAPPRVGRTLIYAKPGETRDVQPQEFIFYPDDGTLPEILETLQAYEVIE
jgi:hypothetical protein